MCVSVLCGAVRNNVNVQLYASAILLSIGQKRFYKFIFKLPILNFVQLFFN
jgi:hypothetical protein